MDGGMRSGTNADMAKGYDRVLVVIVRGRPVAGEAAAAMAAAGQARLDREFAVLRESGSTVETITPDDATMDAMGANLMNFAVRGPVVEAGLAQGKREAARLASFWKA
jgi:NTE family protein